MIFRTPKIDDYTALYVVEDMWNIIYLVVVDGHINKQGLHQEERLLYNVWEDATHLT